MRSILVLFTPIFLVCLTDRIRRKDESCTRKRPPNNTWKQDILMTQSTDTETFQLQDQCHSIIRNNTLHDSVSLRMYNFALRSFPRTVNGIDQSKRWHNDSNILESSGSGFKNCISDFHESRLLNSKTEKFKSANLDKSNRSSLAADTISNVTCKQLSTCEGTNNKIGANYRKLSHRRCSSSEMNPVLLMLLGSVGSVASLCRLLCLLMVVLPARLSALELPPHFSRDAMPNTTFTCGTMTTYTS